MAVLERINIKDYTGYSCKAGNYDVIKKNNYKVINDISVGGDAPKALII